MSQQQRPNVIVFFTDQQRWDTSGLHGNPLGLMPNFDRMAMHGAHLTQSFTCQPVCGPARSCLQSGKYATTTGCFANGIPLPADTKTMAHYFNEAGYETGYIGKWHLAGEEPVPVDKRGGYKEWLAADVLEFSSDSYDTVLYNNENKAVKLPGYRVDAMTDAAIRYIDRHQEDPFFLFVSFLEPHHQNHRDDYPAPDGYQERYTGAWIPPDLAALGGSTFQHIAGYYGMVKRLDEALGRVLDALKSLQLDENTIVLFTSDHGNHFKTRNGEYKRSGHDASIRVPTAITGPGFFGGRQIRELVSLIDLPPTLLDAAGIPVPEDMQGRSILPLVKGIAEGWPEEVFVQISETQVGRVVRTRRWKYGVTAPDKDGFAEPGSNHYVESYLYDLQSDPYELTNLIGIASHRAVCDVMQTRLLNRMQQAGETMIPTIEAAPVVMAGQRQVKHHEVMS
ncbi:acetylglucosamine-6-sulfatase [Paenibacillus marchantiophytorum]|uniref:Acetylglucosamine-6-sulfatase n=1 Tax=Paenibacillus marchantiophytorum TaxID=1619310 RepID=A0ABQ1EV35_9BACL|nr:sulfatase-like hydrolase/transferase [Paenibacillus marchantiophytorum]GFZ88843.1 acetylglucosamine-6-sulfatase [Paenibacillus marchantiophytorum]